VAGIDPRYYYLTLGALIACAIIGAIVAYRLQRDVQVHDVPPTEKEVLGPLEKAYYSGLMNADEFQRIRQSMSKQKEGPLPLVKPSKARMTTAEPTEPATSTEDPDTESDEGPKV
jgi:hypothetical protein